MYQHQVNRLAVMVRAALIPVIYRKTLTLRLNNSLEASGITLVSTDLERIAFGLRDVHETWASLIEIGLALWLLQRQLDVASVMPASLFIGRLLQDSKPAFYSC
jgi:ATP-binding cassette, subfamily C (CFTR/MRP), member 1